MAKVSKGLKDWRKKQPKGAIMKPKTFDDIVSESEKKGFDKKRAERIAGSAYWKAARTKYQEK